MNFKTKKIIIFSTVILLLNLNISAQAAYKVLHYFTGGSFDGAYPYDSLIRSGSTLYGTTYNGGSNNLGTVFKVDTDGNNFEVLHSFVSTSIDGIEPIGALLLFGSTLYGTASSSNTSYGGTLFRIDTDGNDFHVLFGFSDSNGMWPYHSPILAGSIFYGMCTYGGNGNGYNGDGTIFQIDTDGSDFQLLHTFTGDVNDGSGPHSLLLQSGSMLYGTAPLGGTGNNGVIFKIDANGTGFKVMHRFAGGSNGSLPFGSLILSGSTLYGMASSYDTGYAGTIYRINTDGSDFKTVHRFAGGIYGACPLGSLIQIGSILYGMTRDGGSSNLGTIFKFNTDSNSFDILHNFTEPNGSKPYYGSLILSGTKLYGMASSESSSSNKGVIFALDIPISNCSDVIANGFGLESDLNSDCYVNFKDVHILADYWLSTNCGSSSNCNNADFVPTDGTVNFSDFSDFAAGWKRCNSPTDANCIPNW